MKQRVLLIPDGIKRLTIFNSVVYIKTMSFLCRYDILELEVLIWYIK